MILGICDPRLYNENKCYDYCKFHEKFLCPPGLRCLLLLINNVHFMTEFCFICVGFTFATAVTGAVNHIEDHKNSFRSAISLSSVFYSWDI